MNIQKILNLNSIHKYNDNNEFTPSYSRKFGLKLSNPITSDTCSFKGTAKMCADRTAGVSIDTAKKIHKTIKVYQTDIKQYVMNLFDDKIATEYRPKNPISKIIGRPKSDVSIQEKSATRQWNSYDEVIEFMTDLNGMKMVLRNGSKAEVDGLLDRFIPAIKSREIEIIEIENKRPMVVKGLEESKASKYDYGSIGMLEKLIEVQEEVWNGKNCIGKEKLVSQKLYDDFTDANYCAIHFLIRKVNKNRIFEFQWMGNDVAEAKFVDDVVWKILHGKNVDKKYDPIKKIIKPYADTQAKAELIKQQILEGNPEITPEDITLKVIYQITKDPEFKQELKDLILLNKYRGEVFLFQRKKEPISYTSNKIKARFLPLQYDIDQRLDFNNLYDLIEKCERNTKKPS